MDDLPLQKIQISGPTLSSIIQRFSFSPSDVDGLLFGRVSHIPTSTFSDDDPTTSLPTSSSTLVATITSFFCSNSTSTFYDSTGHINVPSLRNLVSSSAVADHQTDSLLGWFSGRRRTPLRPSMRECSVTSALSSKIQFSFQVDNSPKSYTLPPCIFLILTTPFHDQPIHTHEYRAYQFRISDESFESKTLDVVNIGPTFRGHYGSFSPNSPFPSLNCDLRGVNLMTEDGDGNCESERGVMGVSKDQRQLDLCAEGFDLGQLSRLVGSKAGKYTAELEELYKQMLAKLERLARNVETGSARVLEQEIHNMRLRYRVAGLE